LPTTRWSIVTTADLGENGVTLRFNHAGKASCSRADHRWQDRLDNVNIEGLGGAGGLAGIGGFGGVSATAAAAASAQGAAGGGIGPYGLLQGQ